MKEMAKYTLTLDTLSKYVWNATGNTLPGSKKDRLQALITWLTLNDTDSYPIEVEDHRQELNIKILNHYWWYEIGVETPQLFRDRLLAKLNEIMPYYNQLYASELIQIDPINPIDYTETTDRTLKNQHQDDSKEDTKNTGTSETHGSTTHNDYPRSQIFPDRDYATWRDYKEENYEGSSTGDRSLNNTGNYQDEEDITKKRKGNLQFSQQTLLTQYRATFLNIDMQIIDELYELFMLIY
jgi:hypothetical protein